MNDEHMKQKLSALVDNELDDLEERRVFAALEGDASLRGTWQRYHLVRAALRQDLDAFAALDVSEQVARRIAAEPSNATAFNFRRITRLMGTLAIAASVAAIAIVGVQWSQKSSIAQLPMLAASNPVPEAVIRSGTTQWDMQEPETVSALNAYLVEHDEFASTSGFGGMIPYVRVVSYDNDK